MKTKLSSILTLLLAFVVQISFAQERTISGTVTDEDGLPLPGVNVLIQGTSTGVQTDFDGNYSIVASQGDILVFSFIGLETAEYAVTNVDEIDVVLSNDAAQLDEVVVTALGIKREKKSLGYATQEVDGSEVSDVPTQNFVNSLSGKVAGLKVSSTGTLGGSSNVIIRGNSSLTGNNQALFVIDGTPVSNANNNSVDQQRGAGGYDYGNAASDINPNDIASINVLKGAAATALYGARAANGAIIIETKKGSKNKGIGVAINSTLMVSNVNDQTLPEYQDQYGAGYGAYYDTGYFNLYDVDGDGNLDEVTPFTEDASFGATFDGQPIYQWNSIYPQLDTYQQATPWLPGENNANTIWQTGYTAINSIALDGGTDKSSFRVSATNFNQQGNLPNSEIKRNTIKFSGGHDFTDRFSAQTNVTFTKTDGKGRYGTGYSSLNIMQQFRQWFQTNVDLQEQRDAYFGTGENITWNPNSPDNLSPIYSDNPYWTLYENYQTDTRNRYFGNINLDYEISDVFSVLGRFTFDTYDELQEERINVGSAGVSEYSRYNNRAAEYNYDLILNFNKDITEDLNLDGNLGMNIRRNERSYIDAATNGGLNAPGFYALTNTVSPLNPPTEYEMTRMLDGVYARAGVGYLGTYYLEGTIRRDRSSTLPAENNTFWYPSVSTSILLSNIIEANWLDFAKVRANYAEVGNDTDPYNVFNTYLLASQAGGSEFSAFGNAGWATNANSLNNLNLRPERMKSYEVGLEANFLNRLIGFDVSYYNSQTEDQITPVRTSTATGFTSKLLNAGTIENKGIEARLTLNPIRIDDFRWTMNVNWAKNESTVLELAEGINNLQLDNNLQGGVSINAAPGEPYGAIRGTAYVYDQEGNRLINPSGYYEVTPNSNYIIGNIQPDWTGGVSNTFEYKNLLLSFLVDVQKGGDLFSLDTWYGTATGLYEASVGTNDLGNPMRNTISNGGGVILDGVQGDVEYDSNGEYTVTNTSPNATRARTDYYGNPFGYARAANEGHVYDASYVKLREVNLTYNFGDKVLDAIPFTRASFSVIGRNLWIIHKNIPFSDPEAGLSSGNVQGYQSGAYPSMREIGASLKFNF
ncbi:SusC/RagA family TonB-linked outer membrane protein [Autumnicola psychrophila]|uniref:SusC/RagA family TonB-linked outer membrane protein n=1 Tax=Autumnicola psychrophila TaxID=3075592 RepID=A0ABU3DMB7_9FLAO|nr:SusC/RagA family TonB-linked outer membrane protein [Zunongwangia sp. F225]MDT0684855.1 SusC/RagA family TonB-linked outer membrane protein [Zunongwangia sp. F225]